MDVSCLYLPANTRKRSWRITNKAILFLQSKFYKVLVLKMMTKSPNLVPCDYLSWYYVKCKVYAKNSRTKNGLKKLQHWCRNLLYTIQKGRKNIIITFIKIIATWIQPIFWFWRDKYFSCSFFYIHIYKNQPEIFISLKKLYSSAMNDEWLRGNQLI